MLNVIFTKDINAKFTAIVNEYLGKGMTLHVSSMSGSQGETAKIDVTNGSDVYRILMRKDHVFDFNEEFTGNIMVIEVKKFTGVADINGVNAFHTLWNGEGEIISSEKWYSIDDRKGVAWTSSIQFATECQKKHYARYDIRRYRKDEHEIRLNDSDLRKIVEMCKSHKGYVKTGTKSIARLTKVVGMNDICFKVYFNNGRDALVVKRLR